MRDFVRNFARHYFRLLPDSALSYRRLETKSVFVLISGPCLRRNRGTIVESVWLYTLESAFQGDALLDAQRDQWLGDLTKRLPPLRMSRGMRCPRPLKSKCLLEIRIRNISRMANRAQYHRDRVDYSINSQQYYHCI